MTSFFSSDPATHSRVSRVWKTNCSTSFDSTTERCYWKKTSPKIHHGPLWVGKGKSLQTFWRSSQEKCLFSLYIVCANICVHLSKRRRCTTVGVGVGQQTFCEDGFLEGGRTPLDILSWLACPIRFVRIRTIFQEDVCTACAILVQCFCTTWAPHGYYLGLWRNVLLTKRLSWSIWKKIMTKCPPDKTSADPRV